MPRSTPTPPLATGPALLLHHRCLTPIVEKTDPENILRSPRKRCAFLRVHAVFAPVVRRRDSVFLAEFSCRTPDTRHKTESAQSAFLGPYRRAFLSSFQHQPLHYNDFRTLVSYSKESTFQLKKQPFCKFFFILPCARRPEFFPPRSRFPSRWKRNLLAPVAR